MISTSGNLKIVDQVFVYPASMSDVWIQEDIIRSIFKMDTRYGQLNKSNNVLVIFAHGISDSDLQYLVRANRDKKILFVYCGENIYNETRLVSKAFSAFNKLRLPQWLSNKLLFNSFSLDILKYPISSTNNSFFNHLVHNERRFRYVLTNDFGGQKDNIFFAPYFYFFCRAMMELVKGADISARLNSFPQRRFCAFIVSNPNNIERIKLFKSLSSYKRVDSFGKVFNNIRPNEHKGEHYNNLLKYNYQFYENYKFAVCFENSDAPGYITEKLVNVMAGGAVPIYWGDSGVSNYFNKESFLNYKDFESLSSLVSAIIELDQNDQKYLNMISKPNLINGQFPNGYQDLHNRLNHFLYSYFE